MATRPNANALTVLGASLMNHSDRASPTQQPTWKRPLVVLFVFIAFAGSSLMIIKSRSSAGLQAFGVQRGTAPKSALPVDVDKSETMFFNNPFARRRRSLDVSTGQVYHATEMEVQLATLMSITETFTAMNASEGCWKGQLLTLEGHQSTNSHFRETLSNKPNMMGHFEGLPGTLCAGTCVVAFQGTRSYGDWVRDAQISSQTWCGMTGIHTGFAKETEERLSTSQWNGVGGIKDALIQGQSNGTCREIYSIGQSMGAATASLFAYCARQPEDTQPADIRGTIFPETPVKLYGYGSPAFQWRRSENIDIGGIEGLRYYTKGNHGNTDLVPGLLQKFGFNNPKIPVVELDLDTQRAWKLAEPWASVVKVPDVAIKKLDMSLHNMKSRYLKGIEDSFESRWWFNASRDVR